MLGAIESLLSAIICDGMTRTRHDPNAELVGLGVGGRARGLDRAGPGIAVDREELVRTEPIEEPVAVPLEESETPAPASSGAATPAPSSSGG